MLASALSSRPKPKLIITFLSSLHHHHYSRFVSSPPPPPPLAGADDVSRRHSSTCRLSAPPRASIWHAIVPSSSADHRRSLHFQLLTRAGEGSWNAALDARPARWLHRADSAWLLFGVCACLAPMDCAADDDSDAAETVVASGDEVSSISDEKPDGSDEFRVTGVLADGRCLFRAIAYGACSRNGEEAPDENRQRELADELRARVGDELLKRREELKWFIEGDYEEYVDNIQKPFVWGGEPELLMASHVLKSPIWVYTRDKISGGLANLAKYGEEYGKEEETPISVLFHGYGHYDFLEAPLNKTKA